MSNELYIRRAAGLYRSLRTPMKARTSPAAMRMVPATPNAGVIFGWRGRVPGGIESDSSSRVSRRNGFVGDPPTIERGRFIQCCSRGGWGGCTCCRGRGGCLCWKTRCTCRCSIVRSSRCSCHRVDSLISRFENSDASCSFAPIVRYLPIVGD